MVVCEWPESFRFRRKSTEATLGTGDGHFSGSRTGHVERGKLRTGKASHELRLHRVAARRDACSRRCRLRSRWACLALNGRVELHQSP